MGKAAEYVELLLLRWIVGYRNFIEYLRVVRRFYSNARFRQVDLYLLRHYLGNNPYRIAKKYFQSRGIPDVDVYGETPLTTFERIARECSIDNTDVVYELGSGRGRICFWLHCFKKCQVVGVECVSEFVAIAQEVQKTFHLEKMHFLEKDILQVDFAEASVVYFYGTKADSAFVASLIQKFRRMRAGAKVITVSYPLTHCTSEPLFRVIRSFSGEFTWGEAEIFIHERIVV